MRLDTSRQGSCLQIKFNFWHKDKLFICASRMATCDRNQKEIISKKRHASISNFYYVRQSFMIIIFDIRHQNLDPVLRLLLHFILTLRQKTSRLCKSKAHAFTSYYKNGEFPGNDIQLENPISPSRATSQKRNERANKTTD